MLDNNDDDDYNHLFAQMSALGISYGIVVIISSPYYFIRGAIFSTPENRFNGGIKLLTQRAPVLGTKFVKWKILCTAFSVFFSIKRKNYDFLNIVLGVASTCFLINLNGSLTRAITFGTLGGAIYGSSYIWMKINFMNKKRNFIINSNKKFEELKNSVIKECELQKNH
jgi:hypothetical protein